MFWADDGAQVVADLVQVGHEVEHEQQAQDIEQAGRAVVGAPAVDPGPDDQIDQGQAHVDR
jgi:hypothetical protein